MTEIVKKEIIGSVISYETALAELVESKLALGVSCQLESNLLNEIANLADSLAIRLETLEEAIKGAKDLTDIKDKAYYYREVIFESMQSLREVVDELETLVDSDYWPLPTYSEMLFSVI